MTEIPEHLLKRSKQRRQAMGLGGDDTGDAAAATPAGDAGATAADASAGAEVDAGAGAPAVAPAAARSAAPARVAPAAPPAPPDPPYVAAARHRRKVPVWAAPVLALLPLWGFIYYQSLQKPSLGADDPLALGAEVYNVKGGCAGCHLGDGAGGIGAKLKDGEVLKTFSNPLSMVHWIAYGGKPGQGARENRTYGDLNRPGGPHNLDTLTSEMPAFKDSLTPEELAAVTMYVRETISGSKPEKGFSATEFPTLGEVVKGVVALGPGGDPKVPGGSTGTGNQTAPESRGEPNNQKGGSEAGSDAGTNKSDGGTGSSGNSSGEPDTQSGGAAPGSSNSGSGTGKSDSSSSGRVGTDSGAKTSTGSGSSGSGSSGSGSAGNTGSGGTGSGSGNSGSSGSGSGATSSNNTGGPGSGSGSGGTGSSGSAGSGG